MDFERHADAGRTRPPGGAGIHRALSFAIGLVGIAVGVTGAPFFGSLAFDVFAGRGDGTTDFGLHAADAPPFLVLAFGFAGLVIIGARSIARASNRRLIALSAWRSFLLGYGLVLVFSSMFTSLWLLLPKAAVALVPLAGALLLGATRSTPRAITWTVTALLASLACDGHYLAWDARAHLMVAGAVCGIVGLRRVLTEHHRFVRGTMRAQRWAATRPSATRAAQFAEAVRIRRGVAGTMVGVGMALFATGCALGAAATTRGH